MDILIEEVIPEETETEKEEEDETTTDSESSQAETTDEDYSDKMSSEKEGEVQFIYKIRSIPGFRVKEGLSCVFSVL